MTGRLLLPLAAALLVSLSSPAAAAPKPADAGLTVVLRCDACTGVEAPAVGLLWHAEQGAEPPLASLATVDWSAGAFQWQSPDGAEVLLQAEPANGGGWSVAVPLTPGPRPFRLVAALEGFTADRSAWWPEREAGPYVIEFEPVPDVLDRNPAWDPQRTGECEVLVAKTASKPVTFFVQGQPRAWLYPAPAAADGTPQWTFQFVRPGEGLLERVNVLVPAFDEDDSWTFRLPLQAVFSGGATWPSPEGGVRPAPGGEAVDEIRVGDGGVLRLSDCPRATR